MKNGPTGNGGDGIDGPQNATDGYEEILAENEATLIATLANLSRLAVRGSADAAKMIANLGLKCACLLSEGLQSPQSPHKEAVVEAARSAEEWPIICPAIVDRRMSAIENQIPPMLGKEQPVWLGDIQGTGGRRDYHPDSRTGFAYRYFQDLEKSRQLAETYATPLDAIIDLLAKQGNDALRIVIQRHLLKEPEGPLLTADATGVESIGDLVKFGPHGPEIDFDKIADLMKEFVSHLDDTVVDDVINVVPKGIPQIWDKVAALEDFSAETISAWIDASIALAEARCGGKWANGPWRETYKIQAAKRLGTDENAIYGYIIKTLIKGGYPQLLDKESKVSST